MKISASGLELVKAFEGYFAKPYRCPAGVLTQGYGHTAAAGKPDLGGSWSKDYATKVLEETIGRNYAAPVASLLTRKPDQGQFDAMVSLAYNIGVGNFRKSSVLRKFNAGDDAGAVAAFAMWNKAAGKVMPGLTRRRASESLMYQGVPDLNFDGKSDKPVYGKMPQNVDRPKGTPAAKSTTNMAAASTGAIATVTAANETAKAVRDAGETFSDMAATVLASPWPWLALLAIAGAVWIIRERIRHSEENAA